MPGVACLRREIALFASAVLLAMSAVFGAARAGFPIDRAVLTVVCGIGLLFVNLPVLGGRRWFNCGPAMWIYPAFVLALAGFLPKLPASAAGWCGAAAGWALLLWNCVQWQKSRTGFPAVLAGLWVGLFCAGVYWGSGYANPLFEYTVLTGTAHRDTLFHASLANMIRTHGIPSTGLDGVPYVHYHAASHWLVARFAQVAGAGVWAFYNYAFGVIFLPLLVSNVLLFAGEMLNRQAQKPPAWLFWATSLAGFVGVLPNTLAESIGLDPELPWVSESYVAGICLSFTILGIALAFYRELPEDRSVRGSSQRLAVWAVFPALLVVCGFAKISILYLLIGMGGYVWLRLGLWRQPVVTAGLVLSMLLAYGASRYGIEQRLSFPTVSDRLAAALSFNWRYPYYFVFYFFWLWVLLLAGSGPLRERWKGRKMAVELLAVCCIWGIAPGLVLDLSTNSEYFSHYQVLLGAALVLAELSRAWPKRTPALYVCALLLGWNCAMSTLDYGKQAAAANIGIRRDIAGLGRAGWRESMGFLLASGRKGVPHGPLMSSPRAQLLELFAELEGRPPREKRDTAIYIPLSNRVFWTLSAIPSATPLVVPALTGMAMTGGVPANLDVERWQKYGGYGYRFYAPPARESPAAMAVKAVEKAFAAGFQRVIIIDQWPDGSCCSVSERKRVE